MPKANFYQDGKTIDFTNGTGSDIKYGDVVSLTNRVGVAGEDIPAGATGSLHVEGVFEMPAVNNAAFSVGDALYWDVSAQKITKTSTDNTPAGWAVYPKAQTGATAYVKIG